jgi:branched-chain amino acid transport system permease protein
VNLAGALPFVGGDLELAVALAIIIGVLLVRPNGIFGRPSVRRV